jgi:thiamine-phosphate pyrophosphorylase
LEDLRRCLLLQARHAISAGVDVLQIRERDLDAAQLAGLVADVIELARGSRTAVLVNDRVDVALACGAAGVHLRADSLPPAGVRGIVPRGFRIGRSVHSAEEALGVEAAVDYLVAGTVWPSESKAGGRGHATLGAAGLARIAAAVRVPVLAIGGVALDRVGEVARTGAAGVAAIGLFMAPAGKDGGCRAVPLEETVEAVRRRFDSVRSPS